MTEEEALAFVVSLPVGFRVDDGTSWFNVWFKGENGNWHPEGDCSVGRGLVCEGFWLTKALIGKQSEDLGSYVAVGGS